MISTNEYGVLLIKNVDTQFRVSEDTESFADKINLVTTDHDQQVCIFLSDKALRKLYAEIGRHIKQGQVKPRTGLQKLRNLSIFD